MKKKSKNKLTRKISLVRSIDNKGEDNGDAAAADVTVV